MKNSEKKMKSRTNNGLFEDMIKVIQQQEVDLEINSDCDGKIYSVL